MCWNPKFVMILCSLFDIMTPFSLYLTDVYLQKASDEKVAEIENYDEYMILTMSWIWGNIIWLKSYLTPSTLKLQRGKTRPREQKLPQECLQHQPTSTAGSKILAPKHNSSCQYQFNFHPKQENRQSYAKVFLKIFWKPVRWLSVVFSHPVFVCRSDCGNKSYKTKQAGTLHKT